MTYTLQPVALSFIELHVADGVATLTLNRPRSGNALNWVLLEQLRSALARATESPDVEGIVIAAAGRTFVSGADVNFFVRCLEAGNLPAIIDCIRAAQDVFAQIAACPKPVVAAVQGAAVGGGLELALACRHIVATPRASFSFPETGLGIVPAAGGTYRTPPRIGVPLTRWLIYSGYALSPPKALTIGLIDALVPPGQLAEAAAALAHIPVHHPPLVREPRPPEVVALEAFFASARLDHLHAAPSEHRAVAAALNAIAERPLPALQWAEALLDNASDSTPAEAAEAALAAAAALFGRADVHHALTHAAVRQSPAAVRE